MINSLSKFRLDIAATILIYLLLLQGCDVHEFPDVETPAQPHMVKVDISFTETDWPILSTVEWDSRGGSRSSRATDHRLRYTLNIYNDDREADSRVPSRALLASETVITDLPESLVDEHCLISVDLKPGNYSALVWIDHVDALVPEADLYYSTSDFANITLLGTDHAGNTHHREAFRGFSYFAIDTNGEVTTDNTGRAPVQLIPVEAARPMARFEFITTDLDEFVSRNRSKADETAGAPILAPSPVPEEYRVRFRYSSYMPSTYNAHTNKPVDSRLGVNFDGSINRLNDKEASLGFDHVFVNGTETTVQVALDVYRCSDNKLIASSSPITIPLKRNRHTIVKGRFLTSTAQSGVGIDPGFDGEYDIIIK